jgi:hypothetical protein
VLSSGALDLDVYSVGVLAFHFMPDLQVRDRDTYYNGCDKSTVSCHVLLAGGIGTLAAGCAAGLFLLLAMVCQSGLIRSRKLYRVLQLQLCAVVLQLLSLLLWGVAMHYRFDASMDKDSPLRPEIRLDRSFWVACGGLGGLLLVSYYSNRAWKWNHTDAMRSREREATAVLDQQLQQAMAASLQQQASPEIEFAAFKPVAQHGNVRMSIDEARFNAFVFAVPSPRASVGDPPFPSSSPPVLAPVSVARALPAEAAAVDIDVGDIELVEDGPGAGAGGGRLLAALEQEQQRGVIDSPSRAAQYQQRMEHGQWDGVINAPRSPSLAQAPSVSPLSPSRAQRSMLPNPAAASADQHQSLSPLALARRKAAERQQWHSLALKLGLPTAAEAQAFAEEQNYSQETIKELLLAEQ